MTAVAGGGKSPVLGAPKLAESIPAVTAPVKMPRLAPRRGGYVANVVTGAVLIVVCIVGLAYGMTL